MSSETFFSADDFPWHAEQESDQHFGMILRKAALTALVFVTVLAFYPLSGGEIPTSALVVQKIEAPSPTQMRLEPRPSAPMPLGPMSIAESPPQLAAIVPPVVVNVGKIPRTETVQPIQVVQMPQAEILPNRSRDEIEQVFLRNKQAISEVYNLALRRDPNLKGMLVLKMTIEPSGAVTACEVLSSEFEDEMLLRELVERVRQFRFEDRKVAPITTVKPIDFYPV